MSVNPNISGGFAQDYIDRLEQGLKDAENTLKINSAYYNSAAYAYNEAKAWEDKLKRYWDNIKQTDVIAQSIIDEITKLDQQAMCVCDNAMGYKDSVKILVCCVKNAASMLETMSTEMTDLLTRIDCVKSKDPVLDPSKSILKCLYDFKNKLDSTLKSALDALRACLVLLRAATLLLDEKKALRSYIDWLQELGQIPVGNNLTDTPSNLDENCATPDPSKTPPCPPIPVTFPCDVSRDVVCVSLNIAKDAYYYGAKTDYEKAEKDRLALKNTLDQAMVIRDGALTKRDAAIKALSDAKAAKVCK